MTDTTKTPTYFDLTATGYGYLNRARLVEPKGNQKFDPYYAVSISALTGSSDNVEYRYISCNIVGKQAIEAVKVQMNEINDKDSKVTCVFKVGDLNPTSYQTKKGETQHSIDARLLKLDWIKVDGKKVFEHVVEEQHEDNANAEIAAPQAPEAAESQTETPEEPTAEVANPFDEKISNIVVLSKDDANFEAKKTYLKANGYSWNNEEKNWVKK